MGMIVTLISNSWNLNRVFLRILRFLFFFFFFFFLGPPVFVFFLYFFLCLCDMRRFCLLPRSGDYNYNYRSSKIIFSIVIITILADIQNHGWSGLINALDMPCKNKTKSQWYDRSSFAFRIYLIEIFLGCG